MDHYLNSLNEILKTISGYIWGLPTITLLFFTGIYLTFLLKGIQFRRLWYSIYLSFIKRKEEGEGDISHFQALMTALSATVGIGNIVGVATALTIGGPGALFWMWLVALFGMATKYSEAILAVKYRVKSSKGEMKGGPMYYLSNGLNMKWLGLLFAFFASIAAFGIGNMAQSNSVASGIVNILKFKNHNLEIVFTVIVGITLAFITGLVILGGIKSIAKATSFLTPIMVVVYVTMCLIIIFVHFEKIPYVISLIFKGAFNVNSAAGGGIGYLFNKTIKIGIARGIFSNESGLGSSPIAAAAAKTKYPGAQALVSMLQTFIDTIIVCSMTGFVLIASGKLNSIGSDGKVLKGAGLTMEAFNSLFPYYGIGKIVVVFGLITFAYSTLLGWSYYGEKAIEFLLGERSIYFYRWLFCFFVFIGAVLKLEIVWNLADIMNGLMAIPNLIGLIFLSNVISSESKKFEKIIIEQKE